MGIYINMEMPTEGQQKSSLLHFNDDGTASIVALGYPQKPYKVVPVPPHGDLIDRDALRESIGESIEKCHKWADEVDKDTMMYARISQSLGTFVECSLRAKAAPTIIPAEEGDA